MFHFKMFLLIFVLRESAGDTFFYHYGKGNHTLICNKAADKDRVVWCNGRDGSSLLTFKKMNFDKKEACLQSHGRKQNDALCTERNISIAAFSSGGIFACMSMKTNGKNNLCPVFSYPDHCNTYDFFIIAIIHKTAEQDTSMETSKALKPLSVEEDKNFSLSCEFEMKSNLIFTVYWFKDTNPATCIFSATNEERSKDLNDDLNCCINDTIKQRRVHNSTGSQESCQRHDITIMNATLSDSGRYLCVVSTWNKEHKWKIISNLSVEVQLLSKHDAWKFWLFISMGVIGGIVLIGGMACFLLQKKKCKGKPFELHHERTQPPVELQDDECTPYAVSRRNDIDTSECVYSLAGSPGVPLKEASTLPDDKTPSNLQPGENVEAIYTKVNKQK